VVHPDDLAATKQWYSRFDTASDGQVLELKQRLYRADGSYRWFSVRATVFERAADGRAKHIIGVASDIMERVQTDVARGKLASIIEFSDDAILSKDLNGIITSWNRGAERLFGYSEREAIGQPVTMLIPADRADEETVILERIRKGEPIEHYETIRRRKDGMLINLSLTVSPIKDAEGKVIGASKIARDITERKNAEKALREAQLQRAGELEQLVAERTAKLQSTVAELEHFSYTITHDMRAPLRALQGFGRILMEESSGRLTPEGADYLPRIIEGANRLDSLIQDSLQYARIVRNRMPLGLVEPSAVLRGILESYPNLQNPHTEIQIVESLPPVMANATGLSQCFSNLLADAIKFVKPGQAPHVRVWAETRGDFVRFWFEDNGIGIAREYHERIFDMFQQLNKSYEGTGIGLALVRKTAERMEGKVGVQSEPGKGSCFWLELKRADLPGRSPSTPRMDFLIIDDDKSFRDAACRMVEGAKHYAEGVGSGAEGLALLKQEKFQAVMLDDQLDGENGLDLLPRIHGQNPGLPVIMFTAEGNVKTAVEAVRRGAVDFLEKPIQREQFLEVLARLHRLRQMDKRIEHLQREVAESKTQNLETSFNFATPVMKEAMEVLLRAAKTHASILILGESGTGKTAAARAIHQHSHLAHKPFVTVSCPSLSKELLESELFGHVRGAYTGAIKDRWGKVRAAEGGTLFLDEIGDLPMEIQPKLLRLLQEREYERLGENTVYRANVRVIAATNCQLKDRAAAGAFREDLYFRLNVISVEVPPLRERTVDLENLASHYLEHFSHQCGRQLHGFSPQALDRVRSYRWPGNLRELCNAVERAVILARGQSISSEDLPAELQDAPNGAAPGAEDLKIGSFVSLDKLEEVHIRQILAKTDSLAQASGVLGIDQATLYRKRKRIGLQ
jgi:NtrC-family two-component system response regulator AlgB